jgi:arylsulfatase A-like enzyme
MYQPDVALLWLSEPDLSFHYRGVGSPESLEALRAMDEIFGAVLAWRDAQTDAANIQIIALSDHGQVAVKGQIDVIGNMQAAAFRAADHHRDDVDYVVLASSSGNIWVRNDDPKLIRAMAGWLVEQDWLGMLFARDPAFAPGALPLDLVQNNHPRTPPLCFILGADNEFSRFGLPGRSYVGADPVPDDETGGVHGGLHSAELATLLAFEGTIFKRGAELSAPAGLVDIAPTILAAYGLGSDGMQGRPLTETFVHTKFIPEVKQYSFIAASGNFHQLLKLSEVAGRRYIEGGGRVTE